MPPSAENDRISPAVEYGAHLDGAYLTAWRVTRNHDLALEAVQDALVCLCRGRASYDREKGAFGPWLRTIVHRRAVDLVRAHARHPAPLPIHRLTEQLLATQPGPEEQACQTDESRRVRRAVLSLSSIHRQPLVLAYYEGHTQVEIARMLGIPLGTVKTRTRAGKRELRLLLTVARR